MSINQEVGFLPSGGHAQKLVTKVLSLRITHVDLTAAATTQAISFATLPSGPVWFLETWADLDVAFAGGSISALTVSLGDAVDHDEILDDVDGFATLGAKSIRGARAYGYMEAGHTPIVTITATGDNVVNATAGEVVVYCRIAYVEER